MEKVQLVLAIHSHQPVGNFDFVFERATEQCYSPFLTVLERHPQVRLALHYSGPLLEWLESNRPEVIDRIGKLCERGQVELLGRRVSG
jgi:4-alpha-glucanotransferase